MATELSIVLKASAAIGGAMTSVLLHEFGYLENKKFNSGLRINAMVIMPTIHNKQTTSNAEVIGISVSTNKTSRHIDTAI